MGSHNTVATCLATNVGRVRTNNEDALAEDRELGLLVLADGMGGYNAGEVASSIAATTIVDVVRRHHSASEPAAHGAPSPEGELLRRAVQTAHDNIRARALAEPLCSGMGTTAIACLIRADRLTIAHVGDSRVYRWRNGQFVQLTQDHSLLEELILRGHYSRENASRLVRKNIVTRALGVEAEVNIDLIDDKLETGDLLLMCSDGLTDMLDDNRIAKLLGARDLDLPTITASLIDAALQAGGRDNVSVALARIDSIEGSDGLRERLRKWRPAQALWPKKKRET